MASLDEIFRDMRMFRTASGKTRSPELYPHIRVYTLEYTGWIAMKSLMFKAEVESQSNPYKRKLVSIIFFGMDYSKEQDKDHPFGIKINDDQWYVSLPHKSNHCGIRCSCEDFFFTWGWYLADKKSLIGPRPKYKRKTDYWPPRNPLHKAGVCKHVWALIRMLEQGRVLLK